MPTIYLSYQDTSSSTSEEMKFGVATTMPASPAAVSKVSETPVEDITGEDDEYFVPETTSSSFLAYAVPGVVVLALAALFVWLGGLSRVRRLFSNGKGAKYKKVRSEEDLEK